jgi:hypothetical protein
MRRRPLNGGMAEWSIAAVLKTVGRKPRGFESLSLRRNQPLPTVMVGVEIDREGACRRGQTFMALLGSLRQFSLADALRLIEAEMKTGRLVVERAGQRVELYFQQGRLIAHDREGGAETLGQRLVAAGVISHEQYQHAVALHQGLTPLSDTRLALMLIDLGYCSQDTLRDWTAATAIDLIASLFGWTEGDFRFEENIAPSPNRLRIPLALEPLLAAARRRAAGHRPAPMPRQSLTSSAILTFADRQDQAIIQLTRQQWQLLTLIDGRTPLWIISRYLRTHDTMVVHVASQLVNNGIAMVIGNQPQPSMLHATASEQA